MNTIPTFLEEFGEALKISGSRRRRILAEAYDHLAEAKEQGIKAGLGPAEAEAAAVDAFGDPVELASRFEADFRTRTLGRASNTLDAIDGWRVEHSVTGVTLMVAPIAGLMGALWSPWIALGCVPIWVAYLWVGRQLASRHEPGYRRRLWAWKQEPRSRYNLVMNIAGMSGGAWTMAMVSFDHMHHLSAVLFLLLLTLYPLIWILNNPKPYYPPASES